MWSFPSSRLFQTMTIDMLIDMLIVNNFFLLNLYLTRWIPMRLKICFSTVTWTRLGSNIRNTQLQTKRDKWHNRVNLRNIHIFGTLPHFFLKIYLKVVSCIRSLSYIKIKLLRAPVLRGWHPIHNVSWQKPHSPSIQGVSFIYVFFYKRCLLINVVFSCFCKCHFFLPTC